MISLLNKVVVVTGATSGLGRETALAFGRRGAHLVASGRRRERLDELREILKTEGHACHILAADVTVESDVQELMRSAVDRFGRIDVLVNCAGRGLRRPIKDTSMSDWNAVIGANLTGVFLCSREAIRVMIDQPERGHIITVSSIAGIYGTPSYAAYCASKHGVTGFARSLKWELRKAGIRGSTIHPGRIDTEFFDVYPSRPGRKEMLPAVYIVDLILAVAQRAPIRRIVLFFRNLIWRVVFMVFGRA